MCNSGNPATQSRRSISVSVPAVQGPVHGQMPQSQALSISCSQLAGPDSSLCQVAGGTVCFSASVTVRATSTGAQSQLAGESAQTCVLNLRQWWVPPHSVYQHSTRHRAECKQAWAGSLLVLEELECRRQRVTTRSNADQGTAFVLARSALLGWRRVCLLHSSS